MSWFVSLFTRSIGGLPEGYYSRQFFWGVIYSALFAVTAYFLLEYATPIMMKVLPNLRRVLIAWRQTTEEEIQFIIGYLVFLTILYPYSRLMYSRFFRSVLNFGTIYMPIQAMITLNFYNGLVSWVLAPVLAPACFVYLFFANKPSVKPKKSDNNKDASNLYL